MPSGLDPQLLDQMWRSQRRFGHKAARLYPLVDQTVRTQEGRGRLWQVLGGRAGVVLDKDPKKVTFVSVEDVKPLKQHVSKND